MYALLGCYTARSGDFLPDKTGIHFWSYLFRFFFEREIFRTKVLKKIKTHFMFNIFFFSKFEFLWHGVEKYCKSGHSTVDNMAHARLTLHSEGYRHTLSHIHRHTSTYIDIHCFTALCSFRYHKISGENDSLCYVCEHKYIGGWENMADTREELIIFVMGMPRK